MIKNKQKLKTMCFDRAKFLIKYVNEQQTITFISVTSNHNSIYEVFYYESKNLL